MVSELVANKPDACLAFAAGETLKGVFAELSAEKAADFTGCEVFNICEYIGANEKSTCTYQLNSELYSKLGITKTHTPSELEPDSYDEEIEAHGGLDLVVLGIGLNGHIGFNEPADELIGGTHLTELTESTIKANSRFFASADDVPRHAITMGIDNIMSAAGVVLVVSGKNKHDALMALLDAPEDPHVPVTLLRRHKNLLVFCDEDAYNG